MRLLRFIVRSMPLVLAGVALGLIARTILGPPGDQKTIERKFDRPLTDDVSIDKLLDDQHYPVTEPEL